MPLFFLLSGFSCTLGYGRKKHQINNEENNTFDSGSFYFGRISRILPVYYFCYFYSLPLIPLGKNSSIRGLLLRCCKPIVVYFLSFSVCIVSENITTKLWFYTSRDCPFGPNIWKELVHTYLDDQ